MLSIFVNRITPRVNYIFNVIFNQLLGVNFQFVASIEQFQDLSGPKLCYGEQQLNCELFIHANQLLFETGVDNIKPEIGVYNGLPALFITSNKESCLPFDLFAASFFLITRYEEYSNSAEDQHGRFKPTESIAFANKFLHLPVINLWSDELKKILGKQFPQLGFKKRAFKFRPSYDIDQAWAFKNKGFVRNSFQLIKSLLFFDFKRAAFTFNVLQNKEKDPFFTFPYLEKIFKSNSTTPIFFFLLGQYGKYDKNVSIKSKNLKILIQKLSHQYTIGIHPSYRTYLNADQLKSEQQTLQQILEHPVKNSRQHFLRLKLPDSYQLLIDAGITDDYTMGYAGQTGFRASIAHPFLWYDLSNETTTNLTVHPFQFMDVTLKQYLKQTPQQAKQTIKQLIDATAAVNGELVSLWHNSSLSDFEGWEGWKAVHDSIFEYANEHLSNPKEEN